MSDQLVTLLVLAGAIALFVWNRLSVAVVAVVTSLALALTGVIAPTEVVAGLGNPVVVFVGTLFVIAGGLEASGVTAWAGRALVDRFGRTRSVLLATVMLLAAVLAALVTPNGAAAAIVPVVVVLAGRIALPTSQLLIPAAFAASAGALLTLSGSPVNVIVADAMAERTGAPFGFFEFALIGLPLVVVTIGVVVLLGPRLLPHHVLRAASADLSTHSATLLEQYGESRRFHRLRVSPTSPWIGSPAAALTLPAGVRVLGVDRAPAPGSMGDPDGALAAGDVVVVAGGDDEIGRLARSGRLVHVTTPRIARALLARDVGLAEVIIRPRSRLVGRTVFPGGRLGDVGVLGVRRLGKDRGPQPTTLHEGDALLLDGTWAALALLEEDDDLIVVDSPDLVRRHAAPLGPRAWRALAVAAATIGLLASGATEPAVAGLAGAAAMVLFRVLGPQEAFRAVSWETLILLGGLIPLSSAIAGSGLADTVATGVVEVVGQGDGVLLLVALFLLTAALGQVISNAATVLVVAPIALAAAAETGISPAPVLMLVAVAGAASFLTPLATPANMIVMQPGGYRFGDYWRLGLVTMLAWGVVAIGLIPLIWPLRG